MGKHSTENKKSIVYLKTIIFLIFTILIIFITIVYIFNKLKVDELEDVINNFFSAIKDNNSELVNKYSNYEELLASFDDMMLKEESQAFNVKKQLFENIYWNIEMIDIEENRAFAIVQVTNKNFKNVITKWMKELVVSKSLGKEITNELALEKLDKVLYEETESKTVIKKIELNKYNQNWIIEVNQELSNLVYPGIDSVIEVLKKDSNG